MPCGAIDFPTGKSLFRGRGICLGGSRGANEAADDQFTVHKIALGEEPARRNEHGRRPLRHYLLPPGTAIPPGRTDVAFDAAREPFGC